MNRVSVSELRSGTCLMMPISRSKSAASLLNCCSSPAKNFLFPARSCQRRYFCDASNCSPVCFTSAPMISKLFFGSFLIMSTASKYESARALAALGLSARNFGVQPNVSITIG